MITLTQAVFNKHDTAWGPYSVPCVLDLESKRYPEEPKALSNDPTLKEIAAHMEPENMSLLIALAVSCLGLLEPIAS